MSMSSLLFFGGYVSGKGCSLEHEVVCVQFLDCKQTTRRIAHHDYRVQMKEKCGPSKALSSNIARAVENTICDSKSYAQDSFLFVFGRDGVQTGKLQIRHGPCHEATIAGNHVK